MSTAVATKPIQHTISWGLSRWVCIHPHCDGYHHVFVRCGR